MNFGDKKKTSDFLYQHKRMKGASIQKEKNAFCLNVFAAHALFETVAIPTVSGLFLRKNRQTNRAG